MHETNEDMVSHPSHYNKGNPVYEPYKVIKAWDCNFNIGNAIKYLARYRNKWDALEDLEKAKQYIDFEIEALRVPPQAPKIKPTRSGCRPELDERCGDMGMECANRERADDEIITDRVGKIVREAQGAMEKGEPRVSIMRNILGMSDEEILDVMRMSDDDRYRDIEKKILRKAGQG